jgi:hypothetical protein
MVLKAKLKPAPKNIKFCKISTQSVQGEAYGMFFNQERYMPRSQRNQPETNPFLWIHQLHLESIAWNLKP